MQIRGWQLRTSSIGVAVAEPSGSCPIGKREVLIFDIVIGPFKVNDQVHQIRPIIDATYGFTELPEALEHLDRGPFGKVVLEAR